MRVLLSTCCCTRNWSHCLVAGLHWRLLRPYHLVALEESGYSTLFVYTRYPFFGAAGDKVCDFKKRRKRVQIYSGICWKSSDLAVGDRDDAEYLPAPMTSMRDNRHDG